MSAFNHCIVAGYHAAEFVRKIEGLLEQLATPFLE